MARTMYDSVTPRAIPRNARMVAGYLPPSSYAWSAADWALFPRAVKVRIAIAANVNGGHVLDVEPGDATPAQAPGWVRMRRRAGVDPTVYCNLSTWPAVQNQFRRQGVAQPHYWIARYDNRPVMIRGAVAKQYADPGTHGGGHYDLSIVADYWPGVDPKEDDLSAQELLDWPIRRMGSNLGGATSLRAFLANADSMYERSAAREGALLEAVTALSADPDLTADRVARMLDDSVAAHAPTVDRALATQLELVRQAIREVVSPEEADRIMALLEAEDDAADDNG